jgi:hypothetical protein
LGAAVANNLANLGPYRHSIDGRQTAEALPDAV